MLQELRIREFAILPAAEIRFGPGLNILTGETGAGKSILVDAIGLLAGRRASATDVRSGASQAFVEGVIAVPTEAKVMRDYLASKGVALEEQELIIRRVVFADGGSKAFVNNQTWTLSDIAHLAQLWIDITGQHAQHQLLRNQMTILDQFGDYQNLLTMFEGQYDALIDVEARIKQLKSELSQLHRDKDYVLFQLRELESIRPVAGEYDQLLQDSNVLKNVENIRESLVAVESVFDHEGGLLDHLAKVKRLLDMAVQADPGLSALRDRLQDACLTISDVHSEVNSYMSRFDNDLHSIDKVNARLSQLQILIRKYGSIDQALTEQARMKSLLALLDDNSCQEESLEQEHKEILQSVLDHADKLSKLRLKASHLFVKLMNRELALLGMSNAKISLHLCRLPADQPRDQIGRHGAETAIFYFSANPGEGEKPLEEIVSGGELSRILLAAKSLGTPRYQRQDVAFLFDEIDAGIGGAVAERVGLRLKALAQGRQVLCVTHLAQIACYADLHLHVHKQVEGGRTAAHVASLDTDQRCDELARMMAGIEKSEKIKAYAQELLMKGTAQDFDGINNLLYD